jgi:hypothetical protein
MSNPMGDHIRVPILHSSLPGGAVSIKLNEDKINLTAYYLAAENKPWQDLVWLYAEAELRLAPPYVHGSLYKPGETTREVQLFPDRIIDHPPEEEIRALATKVAIKGFSPPDLCWLIAERRETYKLVVDLYF